MFVSESTIFHPSDMKIRISSMKGMDVVLDVDPEFTIDKLKMLAVGHLYDPAESAKLSLYHKLVHVGSGRILNEENTVVQEKLQEQDELLLLRKRVPPAPVFETSSKKDDNRIGPTLDSIKKATEGIPTSNTEREPMESLTVVDVNILQFQAELRKILISLIEVAQKILCLNPKVARIFKEAEQYLEEQNAPPKVDPHAVQQLVDMGFPENRAKKALLLNKMSMSNSIQWLLDNDDNPEIDLPIPGMEVEEGVAVAIGERDSVRDQQQDETEEGAVGGQSPEAEIAGQSSRFQGPNKIANMLESFKAFRRKQFKPNPTVVKNLVEMGFEETQVVDALRISGNKEEQACELLLLGNKITPESDFDTGLDPDSPIYKAIMANPVVQLGLSNPRSLLAFLNMLENPNNTQQWLNDPDTGPMLVQISRIYHAEKHAPRVTTVGTFAHSLASMRHPRVPGSNS